MPDILNVWFYDSKFLFDEFNRSKTMTHFIPFERRIDVLSLTYHRTGHRAELVTLVVLPFI